jgi:hypothetical protein
MYQLIDIIVGVVSGIIFVRLIRRFVPGRERLVYSVGLVFAALVYVGFALANNRSDRLGLEAMGVLLFGAVALIGFRFSTFVLGFGWISHVAWDEFLHKRFQVLPDNVPFWYPNFCIGFDILLGLYILFSLARLTKQEI